MNESSSSSFSSSPSSSASSSSSSSSASTGALKDVWEAGYEDGASGFSSAQDVTSGKAFINGEYKTVPSSFRAKNDNKLELYNSSNVRYIDKSNGFALTFPLLEGSFPVDYSLAQYGLKVSYPSSSFRLSYETNYYSNDEHGYGIYTGEWMDRYIANDKYLYDNDMRRFAKTVDKSTSLVEGCEVTVHSIKVNNPGSLPTPYYKNAWIRPLGQYASFLLIVYKSSSSSTPYFDSVLASFRTVASFGNAKNYVGSYPLVEESHWNEETKNFYEKKMLAFDHFDFGVFSYSMCNDDDSGFSAQEEKIKNEKARLEGPNGLNHSYEIMPTYSHLAWGSYEHTFPLKMANEFAGGNGENGKPVLQFSYQFTTNNNNVSPSNTENCQTPMFDILRGKYDSTFRKIASGLKSYAHPVLLRLNNEMNSDWTSYCGMMTLLDPEIFILTWRYFYDFLIAEGVENAIFVFNPVTVSCPDSYWGEDLSYFPGGQYAQVLGLTNYEMNNSGNPTSFRDLYTSTYDKSYAQFSSFPWFIGEYACGSGGNEDGGTLGSYESDQASWVKNMFLDLSERSLHPYLHNLVGGIWFSCNDESNGLVSNYLRLDEGLTKTLKEFRDGFALLEKSEE